MSVIKTMSIIGIVFSSFCLFCIVGFMPMEIVSAEDIYNAEASMGWGVFAAIWGIAYSITCLVQSRKLISAE